MPLSVTKIDWIVQNEEYDMWRRVVEKGKTTKKWRESETQTGATWSLSQYTHRRLCIREAICFLWSTHKNTFPYLFHPNCLQRISEKLKKWKQQTENSSSQLSVTRFSFIYTMLLIVDLITRFVLTLSILFGLLTSEERNKLTELWLFLVSLGGRWGT